MSSQPQGICSNNETLQMSKYTGIYHLVFQFTSLQLVLSAVWRPQKISPYFINESIIFFSFGSVEPTLVIFKVEYRLNRCWWGREGAYAASQATLLHMKKLNITNQVSYFHSFVCSVFPKAALLDFGGPGVSLTLCCFVVYSTRLFLLFLTLCHIVLVFVSPFSIAVTSLGEKRANLSAFRMFVRFVLVCICRFPFLPLGVWEGLRFVIVALPGLFSYPFCHIIT